jgi:xylan 1,4-beta-xylosidase
VTLARSRDLLGPYELHPQNPVLTSRDRPDAPLQRAGHADLVDLADGSTWAAYLCGRPLPHRGRCVLGRETAIQPMVWGEDGWLRTRDGEGTPEAAVEAPGLPPHPWPPTPVRSDFDAAELPVDFQWLRSPWPDELFSLAQRPGWLRLFGRESLGSQFRQALVARRQQAFCYRAETLMAFAPRHFQQAAGLVCYYGAAKFHYLHVTHDAALGRVLQVMSALPDSPQGDVFTPPVPIPDGPIRLRVEVDHERLRFGFATAETWTWLPEVFDASILSDEATQPGQPNFTGAFVGMACQDGSGAGLPADFDWFDYEERAYLRDPTGAG